MSLAGLHGLAVGLRKQIFAKPKRLLERARRPVRARIGGNSNHGGQCQGRQAKLGIALHDLGEPRAAYRVLRHVFAKGIDKDIYIRQDHLKRFIRSTYSKSSNSWSADMSVRSIPGIGPPLALLTRGRVRFVFAIFRLPATTIRSPSSIRDVNVRPSAAALRLARLSRSSGRRMVVRSAICHDIWG